MFYIIFYILCFMLYVKYPRALTFTEIYTQYIYIAYTLHGHAF